LQQIARRLVFAVRDDDRLCSTFRVAEDGTFADADDSAVTIAPASHVVVAHPALVDSATREKWTRVLDDYEIIQPFPQLQRDAPALSEKELEARSIERFSGQIARGGRFFTLKKNGWSASWRGLTKEIGGFGASLAIEPGIESFMSKPEDQTLGALSLGN